MLLLHHSQSFFCVLLFKLLYSLRDQIMIPFVCSALQRELVLHRTLKISCLSIQNLYLLSCVLTSPFQLHQTFQLCVPPGPTGNTQLFLSLPKIHDFLTIFVHRLLGHLPNTNTDFSDTCSRSCNSVMLAFTSSLLSQHFLGQVLEGNTSPSPVFHQDPIAFFFSG